MDFSAADVRRRAAGSFSIFGAKLNAKSPRCKGFRLAMRCQAARA